MMMEQKIFSYSNRYFRHMFLRSLDHLFEINARIAMMDEDRGLAFMTTAFDVIDFMTGVAGADFLNNFIKCINSSMGAEFSGMEDVRQAVENYCSRIMNTYVFMKPRSEKKKECYRTKREVLRILEACLLSTAHRLGIFSSRLTTVEE